MNKEDFLVWLRGILIVILVTSLAVGVVIWAIKVANVGVQKECERLGDQIGYNTHRFSGACHIEIRPNLWVGEYKIVEFLPLIDCKKDF